MPLKECLDLYALLHSYDTISHELEEIVDTFELISPDNQESLTDLYDELCSLTDQFNSCHKRLLQKSKSLGFYFSGNKNVSR